MVPIVHRHRFVKSLFSAQTLAGFLHGFPLAGEELADEEVGNLPEAVDSATFDFLIAANYTILNLLISTYNAVFHFLVMIIFHDLHLNLS